MYHDGITINLLECDSVYFVHIKPTRRLTTKDIDIKNILISHSLYLRSQLQLINVVYMTFIWYFISPDGGLFYSSRNMLRTEVT